MDGTVRMKVGKLKVLNLLRKFQKITEAKLINLM